MRCAQCIDRTPMSEGDSSSVVNPTWFERVGDIMHVNSASRFSKNWQTPSALINKLVGKFIDTCFNFYEDMYVASGGDGADGGGDGAVRSRIYNPSCTTSSVLINLFIDVNGCKPPHPQGWSLPNKQHRSATHKSCLGL